MDELIGMLIAVLLLLAMSSMCFYFKGHSDGVLVGRCEVRCGGEPPNIVEATEYTCTCRDGTRVAP